jgi:N-acetylmuramoyl-L-alanine amidase
MGKKLLVYIIFFVFILPFNGVSQSTDDLPKDKPKQGEGVYSFLKRHNLSYSKYGKKFFELNKGKFGKDNSMLMHHEYILPANKSVDINPVFGKKYEKTPITSDVLDGAVFYLVNGHGGPDPGAMGKYGGHSMYEDEYAYDIILRLAKNLISKGAKVHMIIQDPDDGIRDDAFLKYDNDETCLGKKIPLDQLERLNQRVDAVNKLYRQDKSSYKRCIIIHLDSRSKRKQIDVFFYHAKGSQKGKEMASTLRKTFDDKYKKHQPRRGFEGTVSTRNLYVLRKTDPVAVFIELGNIRNYRDQQRFVDENNRQALANWLTDGIIKDFNKHKRK